MFTSPIATQELQARELLSVRDNRKKPPRGPADVDMPFVPHIAGERTEGSQLVRERPHGLQSGAGYKGPRQRRLCPMHDAEVRTLPQCVRAERKGQEAVTGQDLL